MTTTQNARSKAAKDATNPAAQALNNYLDALASGHEQLAASLKCGRARAQRVTEEVSEILVAGQRDALAIARQLCDQPGDLRATAKLVMDAVTAAQERALKFGKLVYEEQAEAGSEAQKLWANAAGTLSSGAGVRPFAGWSTQAA